MTVSDAKRLKELIVENTRLKKLLAESVLENEVTRDALRKKSHDGLLAAGPNAISSGASHASSPARSTSGS